MRSERLQAASKAPNLSALVKVKRDGQVCWRHPQADDAGPDGVIRALFTISRLSGGESGAWHHNALGHWEPVYAYQFGPPASRDEAVRAGLLALSQRSDKGAGNA